MDSTSVEQFNMGFEFAVSQGLPLVGSLVVLGVLILRCQKGNENMTMTTCGVFTGVVFLYALFIVLSSIFK